MVNHLYEDPIIHIAMNVTVIGLNYLGICSIALDTPPTPLTSLKRHENGKRVVTLSRRRKQLLGYGKRCAELVYAPCRQLNPPKRYGSRSFRIVAVSRVAE